MRCTQVADRNFILKVMIHMASPLDITLALLWQLNYEITIGDKDQPIKCVCEKVGMF